MNFTGPILLFIFLCSGCNNIRQKTIEDKFPENPTAEKKLKVAWDSLHEKYGDSLEYVSDIVIKVNGSDSTKEYAILDSVLMLKIYRDRNAYVQKKTNGKRRLRLIIAARPTPADPYYWVQAIEDNGITYHTHFNFQVFDHPFRILLYDTETDSTYGAH